MKKFVSEFREFIAKGNVIDMAVAVVIGAAFGKIITSLVNDIIMPLIGLICGGVNISSLKWVFSPAEVDAMGEVVKEEAALTYGAFIQTIIDFILVALCIFIFLKIILALKAKFSKPAEEPAEEEEEAKPTSEELLAEIRDILKEENKK